MRHKITSSLSECLGIAALMLLPASSPAQRRGEIITENTPSFSEYFSWINNTNEGATEKQTLVNLDFFRWLKDTYGMQLDIYAFDAGAVDGAGGRYGSTDSPRFFSQFPRGFAPIAEKASSMNTRLGLWCGPDGFGDNREQAQKRIDMMAGLAEKYDFGLFKMDAVCGTLRPSSYGYFVEMMKRVRRAVPDFVLLNHRLDLGPGMKYATTSLLGGEETYIDVFQTNRTTATHHRAKAMDRTIPDIRLTEDHGVCLSSCLDYWEDDLVLQAFGRSLILAPELYGNPWLLRDDEYPQLAFYFNLHRLYGDVLINARRLPEAEYGSNTVSRGDDGTRFIAFKNLTWEPVTYTLRLDTALGLKNNGKKVKVRQYHPVIEDLGSYRYGGEVKVEVLPFRAALVKVTNVKERDRVLLSGVPYRIIDDHAGTAEIRLLGSPRSRNRVTVEGGAATPSALTLDGRPLRGRTFTLKCGGEKYREKWHRYLAGMEACAVPEDAEALYYSTLYAADNNALEVRSLLRSGETKIPQVKAARDAFFSQETFRERDLWDRNLFDGNDTTNFSIAIRWNDHPISGYSSFLLDMGKAQELSFLTLSSPDAYSIAPYKSLEGADLLVSPDLRTWKAVKFTVGRHAQVDLRGAGKVRYVRLSPTPLRLSEVDAVMPDGSKADRSAWRASNLFRAYPGAKKAWKADFTLNEIPEGSYLCIALNGTCGPEGAWAAAKINGEYTGCPDRAPSYPSNTWEFRIDEKTGNYTYYLPLKPEMKGKKIEVWALGLTENADLKPEVWITSHDAPADPHTLRMRLR